MLVFAVGIDELVRNQAVSVLSKIVKSAYDPLVSSFLMGGIASQTYIL